MQHAVVSLVEALRYRAEVRRFIADNVIGIFHWHKPSGCTIAMGSIQLPTEMSTRNISWGINLNGADNLTTFMCQLSWNLGASTSWNPQVLSRPYRDWCTFTFYTHIHTVTPQFYSPTFCVFCNLMHFLYSLGRVPTRTIFPRFGTSFKRCQQKVKLRFYYIYIYVFC